MISTTTSLKKNGKVPPLYLFLSNGFLFYCFYYTFFLFFPDFIQVSFFHFHMSSFFPMSVLNSRIWPASDTSLSVSNIEKFNFNALLLIRLYLKIPRHHMQWLPKEVPNVTLCSLHLVPTLIL